MPRDEHQTRIELINPALYLRGWGDSLIREEKTPGGTDIINGDEEITAHNLKYFGEPVYEYSIGAGQKDGYLAACEVNRRTVDLDKKEITKEDIERRSAIDPYTGKKVNPEEIEDRYNGDRYNSYC